MTREKFQSLAAQGYNRIPVMREVLADLDTPLSSYLKLAEAPYSYLLESVQGGEKWGRYSIIGLPCRTRIEVRGTALRLLRDGAHLIASIADALSTANVVPVAKLRSIPPLGDDEIGRASCRDRV